MSDAGADGTWREPTSLLPLRWGAYRTRLAGGLLLIVAGNLAFAGGGGSSAFANALLVLGPIAHITGWLVLPAAGWRRVVAMAVANFAMIFLLSGPGWLGATTLGYLGWLLVRHRPLASYATVLFVPVAAHFAGQFFPTYRGMLGALALVGGTIVASAFAARAVHVAQWRLRRGRTPSIPGPPAP